MVFFLHGHLFFRTIFDLVSSESSVVSGRCHVSTEQVGGVSCQDISGLLAEGRRHHPGIVEEAHLIPVALFVNVESWEAISVPVGRETVK